MIRLGKKDSTGILTVNFSADALDDQVRFRQILAVRSVAFHKVRNSICAQTVHAHVEPITHYFEDFFYDLRIVIIEVRLMGKEAMPIVSIGYRVPCPIGFFGVGENDARVFIFLVGVTPDVEFAFG